ncbi:MAG: TusE/DsrC/DsvC family sulfur relay protein [Pseudomonadota bacterium]
MTRHGVEVDGTFIETDVEGYLLDRRQWSEAFVRAQAAKEGLVLTDDHWQVVRYLREHFRTRGRQAPIPQMIKHFRQVWGPDKGNAATLFKLFEGGGGADRQGYRLAGIGRRKGEG